MDVREKLNKHPGFALAAAIVVVLAISFEAYRVFNPPGEPIVASGSVATVVYYTSDDGKTLFADVDNQVAPVDAKGRPAVKAYVYSCGDKQFVQCLEKYSGGPGSSLMVKEPGATNWIPDSRPAAAAIRLPKCPDGKTPVPVLASNY